jgi:hypothetical protein
MSFDYATIEKIGLNFGKKFHYGLKITKGVIFILYNFIYDFFMLSKTHYNKTKNVVSYSVKNNSVILPGDNVSINDYEGELENKWLLSSMNVKDESIDKNDEYVYILEHVSNKNIVSKQLLDNITLLE